MRFLHSHSMHQAFDRCRAQFNLLQDGAPRSSDASNLFFGRAFHLFAKLYRDHCIVNKRWSDVEIVGNIVDQVFRETGLSMRFYELLSILCRHFVSNENIDIERSLMREGGIALDDDLQPIPWGDDLEYDSPNFRAAGSRAALRMQLDEVLIDSVNRMLIIDDWKTDYYVPSPSEIGDPESRWWKQAMEYAWGAVRYLYPQAIAVEFRFKFVRWNVTRTLVITRDEIDTFGELFVRRIRFIETANDFSATPGQHCRMCPFLTGGCPIPSETAYFATPIEEVAATYIWSEAYREEKRDELKAYAGKEGTIMVGGLPVAIFEKTEKRFLDVQRVLDAMAAEGIENPALLLDVSPSKLEKVLDADQFDRVIAAATASSETEVVFNLHQNKPELVALAESLGIPEPKKLKVAALAQAIVKATSQKAA